MENKSELLRTAEKSIDRAFSLERVKNLDELNSKILNNPREIGIGDCFLIADDDEVATYQNRCSYECMAGIVKTVDKEIYVFQTFFDRPSEKQTEIMKKAVGGIIGGNKCALEEFENFINKPGIVTIPETSSIHDFNFAVVNNNKPDQSLDVYCCYESVEQFLDTNNLYKELGKIALRTN